MKEKFRMGAEKLSAPFRKISSVIKKPFVAFYEKNQEGSSMISITKVFPRQWKF